MHTQLIKKIIKYFTDIKILFGPKLLKNGYYLHFWLSFFLAIPTILFMMFYMHLNNFGLFLQIFIGAFGAGFVNFVREWYYTKTKNSPFDETDINIGSYGGLLGAIVSILFYSLF